MRLWTIALAAFALSLTACAQQPQSLETVRDTAFAHWSDRLAQRGERLSPYCVTQRPKLVIVSRDDLSTDAICARYGEKPAAGQVIAGCFRADRTRPTITVRQSYIDSGSAHEVHMVLVHELAHWLMSCGYRPAPDPGHADEGVWGPGGFVATVVADLDGR